MRRCKGTVSTLGLVGLFIITTGLLFLLLAQSSQQAAGEGRRALTMGIARYLGRSALAEAAALAQEHMNTYSANLDERYSFDEALQLKHTQKCVPEGYQCSIAPVSARIERHPKGLPVGILHLSVDIVVTEREGLKVERHYSWPYAFGPAVQDNWAFDALVTVDTLHQL